MSKDATHRVIDALPRWALVILAIVGIMALKDMRDQIVTDHQTLLRHSVEIEALHVISERLTVLVERKQ